MLQNPFTSKTFQHVWLKHFKPDISMEELNNGEALLAIPSESKLFQYNVGSTLTKGITYNSEHIRPEQLKRPLLIYDVLPHSSEALEVKHKDISFYKTKQYPGFLIELHKYRDVHDYLQQRFSKSSRSKIRKYKRRLEQSFNVKEILFSGEVKREEFDAIFLSFRHLLQKRYEDKQIYNNNLDSAEWNFYRDVAFALLKEQKAALYVMYANNQPISITLLYFSEHVVYDAITVFDIDYSKFHVGSTTLVNLIDWCFKNQMKIFDFSKGYFDYKTRWCTKTYDFYYHIWCRKNHYPSRIVARTLKMLFDVKQYLRSKKINEALHRWTWKIKNASHPSRTSTYKLTELEVAYKFEVSKPIDFHLETNRHLKRAVFEYLYLYQDHVNQVKLFQLEAPHTYLIKGKKHQIQLIFTNN